MILSRHKGVRFLTDITRNKSLNKIINFFFGENLFQKTLPVLNYGHQTKKEKVLRLFINIGNVQRFALQPSII